jgi:hypothetical protein
LIEVISGAEAPGVTPGHGSAVESRKGRNAQRNQMVDTIKELAGLSNRLNQESDTLNDTITSINVKLAKLSIGVEAWVGSIEEGDPFYKENDEDQSWPLHTETWLGYYRFERGWELAVKTVTRQQTEAYQQQETVEATDPLPLLNASRDIRVNAMDLIPQLLHAIKTNAERLLRSIELAKKTAERL